MKTKKAMSVAEILMILLLVSFIATLSIDVIAHFQSNYKELYYSAYRNLQKVVGEAIASSNDKSLASYASPCNALLDSFNTIGGSSTCAYTYNFSIAKGLSGSVTPNLNNPSFTLTNGMRFYVGTVRAITDENYFNSPAFLVAIDLNGTAGPNQLDTRTYTGNKTADVVAFAVLTNGTVLPMSPMADRDDYILANVQRCSKTTGCSTDLTSDLIYKAIPIRRAMAVSNTFPPRDTTSAYSPYQYNTDNVYSFNTAYAVDTNCATANTTYFCRVLQLNPLLSGMGAAL